MNPNRGENIQLEVPVIHPEESETSGGQAIESAHPAQQENAPSKQTGAPPLPPLPASLPAAQPPVIPTDDTSTAPTDGVNEDNSANGKLEKQWVEKAKAIVAKTKDNPYQQKAEISKVQAEYIRTRFNKVVRTNSGDS